MSSKTVRRHDRDLRQVVDGLAERIYSRAEKRQRETKREQGRQTLRERIGVTERPARTFREKCLGIEKEEPPSFDFARELRKRFEERERNRKVRHR